MSLDVYLINSLERYNPDGTPIGTADGVLNELLKSCSDLPSNYIPNGIERTLCLPMKKRNWNLKNYLLCINIYLMSIRVKSKIKNDFDVRVE